MPPGAVPFPFGICRVCKDKATGVHYGVATCEGCKGFFKRTITRGDKYKCFFGGSCDIVPKNRNRCKSCRFRRCMETGMSIEAVRMGRIPKVEKDKALEVFQQTGSDFKKMEIVVQHTGNINPDSKQKSSEDETDEANDSLGEEKTVAGGQTCTLQVSISKGSTSKVENDENIPDTSDHVAWTEIAAGGGCEPQVMENTSVHTAGIAAAQSQPAARLEQKPAPCRNLVQEDNIPPMFIYDIDEQMPHCINIDVCKTEPDPEFIPTNISLLQSHVSEQSMASMGNTYKELPYPHVIPATNPRQDMHQCGPVGVLAPPAAWSHTQTSEHAGQTVHAGNLFSDIFDMDHMRSSAIQGTAHSMTVGAESSMTFPPTGQNQLYHGNSGPVPSSWGSAPVPAYQAGMTNNYPVTSAANSGRYFHGQNQCELNVPNTGIRQAHDTVPKAAQQTVPYISESEAQCWQSCSQTAGFSGTSHNKHVQVSTDSHTAVVGRPNVTTPLSPGYSQSIQSSGSSKYSGQWKKYSPPLVKVLLEHILDSNSGEQSFIDRLKNKVCQSPTEDSTIKTFLSLIDSASRKVRSSSHSSSTSRVLPHSPGSKSDHMDKFLKDVEDFMKMRTSSTAPSTTRDISSPGSGVESARCVSSITSISDDPYSSPTALKLRGCDTSDQIAELSSDTARSIDRFKTDLLTPPIQKKKRMDENFDTCMVSSSFTSQNEEEMDIRMTIDCLKLARDILYRLKPEHRQKLRLYKAGQIKMKVMTDSDEDVQEVYSKIFKSIPLLNERVIGFCENVRGFLDLPREDRVQLQKRAFYDIWMLTFAEYFYDGESHIILSTGELYTSGAMRRILNDHMVDTFLKFSQDFNALKLSDLEISILCAIQLTFTDGLELENLPAAQQLHSHLIDVFDWELKRNHSDNHSRLLINIFKLMPALADINRLQKEVIASYPSDRFKRAVENTTGGNMLKKKNQAMEI